MSAPLATPVQASAIGSSPNATSATAPPIAHAASAVAMGAQSRRRFRARQSPPWRLLRDSSRHAGCVRPAQPADGRRPPIIVGAWSCARSRRLVLACWEIGKQTESAACRFRVSAAALGSQPFNSSIEGTPSYSRSVSPGGTASATGDIDGRPEEKNLADEARLPPFS
jgi:hypothetical protein